MQLSSGDEAQPPGVSNVVRGKVSGVVVQAAAARFTLPSPSPRVRSRYRQYVLQRIAPNQLLERDEELRELAAFCTAAETPSSYRWVRAEAWSGKSALMSWFALNPPDGVKIVSFFVTARLANQNDRAAFVDNVMQQLLDLLNEDLPALMTDATRETHLTGLIDDAAEHCQTRGERLVLLVDGLDEDRGAEEHSIAGMLPASPLAGMRVIVAGRPNPPIPSDVAPSHPLRNPAVVVALARSRHAETAREQMERELKALYRGAPVERDLLGLITAAGGGLSAADLAELTGESSWDVEDLLATVAGRSFTRRETQRHPVYLLGHEELQVAARGMFGQARLGGYRDRIHRWAGGYRERCWPQATPEYLLQGYFNMLAAAGEVTRMVECAADPLRQDRMLDVFGGDALAMEELSATHNAIASCRPVDLLPLTRMAIHRDLLLGRNRNIPADLPALWAVLGQVNRAESIAYSFNRGRERARALTGLAAVVRGLGSVARADDVIAAARDAIRDLGVDDRAQLLAALSEKSQRGGDAATRLNWLTASAIHACCAIGAYGHASRVAASMTDPAERSAVISTAMQILHEEVRLDVTRALRRFAPYEWFPDTEIVWAAEMLPRQPLEVGELVGSMGELASRDPVRVAVLEAELASLRGLLSRAESTTSAARACIALGEVDMAARVLRRLEDRSRARFDVLRRHDVLSCMARAGVRTGRVDLAREVLQRAALDDEKIAAYFLEALAEASDADSQHTGQPEPTVRGELDDRELCRVLAMARGVPETSLRTRALTGVLRYSISVGDLSAAARLMEWASALAASTRPRCQAVDRLVALAVEATRMDLPTQALGLVHKARDLARAERFSAAGHGPLLITVAEAAVEIGAIDLGRRLLLEVDHVSWQLGGSAESLLSFARLAHRTGITDVAEMWLCRAEDVASAQTNVMSRAWWLAQVARTRGEVGDLVGARRLMAEAQQVGDTLESGEVGNRIRRLITDAVEWLRAFDRSGAAIDRVRTEETRRTLARRLQESSWTIHIDDLARLDDNILDAVVQELYVVATRS